MNNGHENQRIKQLLKQWTDVDEPTQQKTWENIEEHLFLKPSPRRRWIVAFTTVIAIIIVTISLLTQQGQAVVQEIKDLFVSEKQENIEIEGDEESTDVKLHTNESFDFIIYVDEDRYKMEKEGDIARIVTKEPLGENYPEVYMEISQIVGKTKAEIVKNIKEDLQSEQMLILQEEEVQEPIQALMIKGIEKDELTEDIRNGWDTMIYNYYVVEVSKEQFFIIKQAYFQEAAEGHGARFHYMLESFEVVQ